MKSRATLHAVALAGAVLLSSQAAPAAVVYVDATEGAAGNTALAAGGAFTSTTAASGTDGLWRSRAFGNGSTIFESGGDNSAAGSAVDGDNEDTPRLATTISGLTPGGTYEIYTFYWDTTTSDQNWRVRSSLTNDAGDLPLFDQNNGPLASTVTFDASPMVVQSDRSLRAASLGNAVADGSGQVVVFVDDDPAARQGIANGWSFRTWYDGVGYEVVPEPASLGLLGTAALLVGRRRRRA